MKKLAAALYAALTAGTSIEDRYYQFAPRFSSQVGITSLLY